MKLSDDEQNIRRFIEQNLSDKGNCSINLYELIRIVKKSRVETVSDLIKNLSPIGSHFELDMQAKIVNIYNSSKV